MKKKKPSKEELKTDNELRKLKLTLEHGAQFKGSEELPPEVENEFLKHIEAFERQAKEKKVTTVGKKLGKTDLKPVEDIPDSEIKKELAVLLKKLNDKQIVLDTLCDVEDRELYRFISEELLEVEMNDMDLPGMITHYIYEEFHPNHPYDIKHAVEDFIRIVLDNDPKYDDRSILDSFKNTLNFTMSSKANQSMIANQLVMFHSAFSEFEISHFEITDLEIIGENHQATVRFDLNYSAKIEGSGETITHDSSGTAKLENAYESSGVHLWQLLSLDMPGLKL